MKLSFSLKSLMYAVFAISVIFSVARYLYVSELETKAKEIAAIGKLSSIKDISIDYVPFERNLLGIRVGKEVVRNPNHLSFFDINAIDLRQHMLAYADLRSLEEIAFTGRKTNDDIILMINNQHALKEIRLSQTSISNLSILHISKFPIRSLHLTLADNISNVSLQYISQIKSLEQLRVSSTGIDDSGVAYLSNMDSLKDLALSSQHITNQGVNKLSLPNLKSLAVYLCDLNDNNTVGFVNMKNLESLDLSHTSIGNKTIESLSKLTKLRSLNIERTKVTPDVVDILEKIGNIQSLNIARNNLSLDEILKLKTALPNCDIVY